jgi:hypothetical protein
LTRTRFRRQMESERMPGKNGVLTNQTTPEPLHLSREELAILSELLESAYANLRVEIRHTDHRSYRNDLRRRLELVERLIKRCQAHSCTGGTESKPYSCEHAPGAGGG